MARLPRPTFKPMKEMPRHKKIEGKTMKRIYAILVVVTLAVPALAIASGGHYAGGHGSSHKGGKYKNARTSDHYEHRN